MRKLVYTMAVLLLSGCASTSITSFKDPLYGNKTYSCVIVFAPDQNFEYRKMYESILVDKIKETGTKGIMAIEIFPPTRTLTKDEIVSALQGSGCESLLFITASGGTSHTTYVSNDHGAVTPIISSQITAEISLWDGAQDKKVWMANANISHNTIIPVGNGIESMMNNSAREIIDKLVEDGMLKNVTMSSSDEGMKVRK